MDHEDVSVNIDAPSRAISEDLLSRNGEELWTRVDLKIISKLEENSISRKTVKVQFWKFLPLIFGDN